MLAQVFNGTKSLYVQAASLRAEDGHSDLALGLNHGQSNVGYIHLFSLVAPAPRTKQNWSFWPRTAPKCIR
ncbi:hypothetical protein [Ruegeria sp. 6PALISEP08]|uniref:hypothetical protein n=1 Tax=Ruegeria sp. 6PALISEP08 TaxID=1225660 RepID=UPI00067EF0CC|nr:hypothetical protein [Ruegeria sp. 6PALISEP08]